MHMGDAAVDSRMGDGNEKNEEKTAVGMGMSDVLVTMKAGPDPLTRKGHTA
jgi:hypothetical protein